MRRDVEWFTTSTVSVSDKADISRHHKSEGWARSGEVSHTGSSEINFHWPLNPHQGDKALKLNSGRGKTTSLTRRERQSSACEFSPTDTHMLLHLSPLSWWAHLQICDRAGTCPQLAVLNWTPPFCRTVGINCYTVFLIIASVASSEKKSIRSSSSCSFQQYLRPQQSKQSPL